MIVNSYRSLPLCGRFYNDGNMIILLSTLLYTLQIIMQQCRCLSVIDVPLKSGDHSSIEEIYEPYPQFKLSKKHNRRYWLVHETPKERQVTRVSYEDEKDSNLKAKIFTLVEQAMKDARGKMKSLEQVRENHRNEAPYRIGFLLNMVKKSKDVLDELYNVAIKHRSEWKALEQLKIYELIVHTNVDTTNLLRQLVDIHLSNKLNISVSTGDDDKKKVILI